MTYWCLDPYISILCALGLGGPVIGLFGMLCSRSRSGSWMWAPLIPAGPLASLLLACVGTAPAIGELPPQISLADLGLVPAAPLHAYTDEGAPVPVYRATILPDKVAYNEAQNRLLRDSALAKRVTMLSAGWRNCNCHGWVFAGGRLFIKSADVEAILRDNAYERVSAPRASDLALYRQPDGQIIHSGIVRINALGQILVESKWGTLGVYLHAPDAHPYAGAACTFYSADRDGHMLQGLRYAPGPQDLVE